MEKFIDLVRYECSKHDIDFYMSGKDHVLYRGIKCNGFFDQTEQRLAVANGKDPAVWHQTIVHEYGHMTQWIEQCKEWKDCFVGYLCREHMVDLWLLYEIEFNIQQLRRNISACRNVELDCEKRSIALIEKYSLPIDIPSYIKRANAYIYFWTCVGIFRKWYQINKEPYVNFNVISKMPTALLDNTEYEIVPRDILEAMRDCI